MRAAEALLDCLESIICSQRDPLFQVRHRYLLYVACIGFLVMVGVQIVLLPYTHYNEYREGAAAPHTIQHLHRRPGRDEAEAGSTSRRRGFKVQEQSSRVQLDKDTHLSNRNTVRVCSSRQRKHATNFEYPHTMCFDSPSLNFTSTPYVSCKHLIEENDPVDPEIGVLYNDRCGFLNYIELVLHERLDMCPNLNQTQQTDEKTSTTTFLSNFKAYRKLLVSKVPQCNLDDPRMKQALLKPNQRWSGERGDTESSKSIEETTNKLNSVLALSVERPLVEEELVVNGTQHQDLIIAEDLARKLKGNVSQHLEGKTSELDQGVVPQPARSGQIKLKLEFQSHEASVHTDQGQQLVHQKNTEQQERSQLPEQLSEQAPTQTKTSQPPLKMNQQSQQPRKQLQQKLQQQQQQLQPPQQQKKVEQQKKQKQNQQEEQPKQTQQEKQKIVMFLSRCSLSTLRTRLLQCIPPRPPHPQTSDTSSTEKEGYLCQFNYVIANIVNAQAAAEKRVRKSYATAPVGSRETSRNSSVVFKSLNAKDEVTKKKDKATARRPRLNLPQIVLSRSDGIQNRKTKMPEVKVNMKRTKK